MRAILIDPMTESVTVVEHSGDYRNIYELIDCETFSVIDIGNGEAIYVDDEGLLHDDPQHFWKLDTYHNPVAGKALVLGVNEEGDSISSRIDPAALHRRLTFPKLKVLGWEAINDKMIDHPILGPNTPLIGHRPVFSKRSKS